jgi:hypothetical protein
MSTNDDITRRDFAKMTAAVTVVASGALGAGSRAAKAAAPAQAMTASDAIGAVARGDLTAEEYAGARPCRRTQGSQRLYPAQSRPIARSSAGDRHGAPEGRQARASVWAAQPPRAQFAEPGK